MAESDADDRWVVELLDVRPDDRVLDVGRGLGVTVALLAERATAGLVRGVDPSPTMLRQAAARNRDAPRDGRVQLRRGDAAALPVADGQFTRACAVHSVYFWPSVEAGLRELRRVLAAGGRLVIVIRMRREGAGVLDPSRYGYSEGQVRELTEALGAMGFTGATERRRTFGHETLVAVPARP